MKTGLTFLTLALLVTPATALPVIAAADPAPKAPPTPQEQLANLNAKAASGDAQATYDLAQVYVDGMYGQKKNDQTAAQWVAKAADLGLAEAQADYAHRLETGKGVKADPGAALGWWLKAADQGQAKAVLRACERLTQGADADWAKAFSYCDTAANAGAATALYARGVALTQGLGTAANPVSGLKDLDAAGDKDNSAALEALGVIYADGKLVGQDDKQALSYFRRAAARGDRDAVLHMAQQIEAGQGAAADPQEAARLYDVLLRAEAGKNTTLDAAGQQAKAWFDAHPKVRRDALADNILKVDDVARDTIFYAVDNDDPRFQTLDLAGYFDYLSQNSYPGEAQNDGVSGEAAAECRFASNGDFYDCVLMQDTPPGYGFGSALMNIFNHLGQSGNKTDWSGRYAGKVLRLSMRWKIN